MASAMHSGHEEPYSNDLRQHHLGNQWCWWNELLGHETSFGAEFLYGDPEDGEQPWQAAFPGLSHEALMAARERMHASAEVRAGAFVVQLAQRGFAPLLLTRAQPKLDDELRCKTASARMVVAQLGLGLSFASRH